MGAGASLKVMAEPYERKHYVPLISAPEGWPPGGRYLPLGPNTQASGDWSLFWGHVAMAKKMLEEICNQKPVQGEKMDAAAAVIDMKENMRSLISSAHGCPAWAHTWALSLLNVVVMNCASCETLRLLALKGGPETDEECAFVSVLMMELGFEPAEAPPCGYEAPCNLYLSWCMHRKLSFPYRVDLKRYKGVEWTSYRDMEHDLSPYEGYNYFPNLQRVCIISCAAKWTLADGEHIVNAKEKDDDHPEGMTVSEKFHSNLIQCFDRVIARATKKGFVPMTTRLSSKDATDKFIEYFEDEEVRIDSA